MIRNAISSDDRCATAALLSDRNTRQPSAARSGDREDDDAQVESLKDQARSAHEEARMVLPGIQALFGFQLIAVFNEPFFDLALVDRALYLTSLLLVAVAIGLVMAPAADHRLVERNRVSRRWLRLAARDVAYAMAALAPAIAIDVYLVALMTTRNALLGVALGAAVAGFLAWLWFARPLSQKHRERVETPDANGIERGSAG
jgi:xanthine/uracil permease